jgi:hypothetical protein
MARQVSSEEFEALLVDVRDGAEAVLSDDSKIEDARAVWRTAEFALGMLNPGRYIPKREALEEATDLVDRLGETKDTGGQG